MTAAELHRLLSRHRLRFGTERHLQDDIERLLTQENIPFVREYRIGKDAVDFLVADSIAVECKVAGGPSAVLEQLLRYAESEKVSSVLLVTSRRTHRFSTDTLNGKPLLILWIAGKL